MNDIDRKNVIKAIDNFVKSSKTSITVQNIKQLKKDLNAAHKKNLEELDDFPISYEVSNGNIYLYIWLIKVEYILKFDKSTTFKFFIKEFKMYISTRIKKCNKIFNYDESEIKQDDYDYNIIIVENRLSENLDVMVIDKETRAVLCYTIIGDNILNTYITDFAAERFSLEKIRT